MNYLRYVVILIAYLCRIDVHFKSMIWLGLNAELPRANVARIVFKLDFLFLHDSHYIDCNYNDTTNDQKSRN
jgi:hypothetical protein